MSPPARDGRTPAEWWTLAAATLILLAIVAVVVGSWASGASDPAALRAGQSGPAVMDGTRYRVPFEVRNEGERRRRPCRSWPS